jgi:hypothetical protein
VLAAALAAAALAQPGCGTCRPGRAAVEPTVGGAVGGGSGGWWHEAGIGLDVTNLFCRDPQPAAADAPAGERR